MSHLIEVDQKEVELEQIEATSAVKVPKRTVVVEPLMVMGIMVIICLRYISTLYVYDRVAQDITSQYGWNNTDNLDNGSQCDVNHSSEVYIVREKVQQKTAAFKAYMNMAYIPAFFVVLFLGSYSDKTGRKYAIMAPCLSTLLKTVCYVLVILFKLPIWVLLVGAFIDGMGGTEYMLYVGTYSYLCDITTKENRAKRLVILEVGFMSAAVTCSLAAGFILKHSHYLYLTLGVLVMSIVMVVYGIFFIPETLTKDRDARFFACTTLAASAKIFTKDNGEGRRWRLQCALVAFSARVMCHHSYTGGILNLFTMNVPLCWQAEMVTYNDVVTRGLALILTPLSAKVFAICLSVRSITLAGGLSEVMLFAYVGAVQNTLMMFIGKYSSIRIRWAGALG